MAYWASARRAAGCGGAWAAAAVAAARGCEEGTGHRQRERRCALPLGIRLPQQSPTALHCHGVVRCESGSTRKEDEASPPLPDEGAAFRRDAFILKNPAPVHADYAFDGFLGRGGFSSVLKAKHKRTGIQRAIKKIAKRSTNSQQFESEVRALISLDHPHIIKVIEYFEDQENFYVVTELCIGQDVFEYLCDCMRLNKGASLSEREAAVIVRQCLKAVSGCQSRGFIHRDLKPENFMIMGKDNTVKLIDFGFARRFRGGERYTEVVGTKAYMAPEMLTGPCAYDRSVDIWSLGVMLFTMLTGEFLLPDGQEKEALQDARRHVADRLGRCEKFRGLSEDARDLLVSMLRAEPGSRISAVEALRHPFVQKYWHGSLAQEKQSNSYIDKDLPRKMRCFAESPLIRRVALLCLAHLAAASVLPPSLHDELLAARHTFRSLDESGCGRVTERQLRRRLEREGVQIPEDFSRTFARCNCAFGPRRGHLGHGCCPEGAASMEYCALVACVLIDTHWPQFLLRETFNILDRSRNGVIEVQDLLALAFDGAAPAASAAAAAIREVDPDADGYINYDKFMSVMGI